MMELVKKDAMAEARAPIANQMETSAAVETSTAMNKTIAMIQIIVVVESKEYTSFLWEAVSVYFNMIFFAQRYYNTTLHTCLFAKRTLSAKSRNLTFGGVFGLLAEKEQTPRKASVLFFDFGLR